MILASYRARGDRIEAGRDGEVVSLRTMMSDLLC